MEYVTADLCDKYPKVVKVADPIFRSFGAKRSFGGQIKTLKVHEDNVLVKELLGTAGEGRVLVIDGGASLRCALVGDIIAKSAVDNGWAGIIVYGCIRDSAMIDTMQIGIKALNTHPLKSYKHGRGDKDFPVSFAGVTFFPEHYVYADADGVIVAEHALEM
ncbi:ribonuclease E activity regulator RraA [Beggiatoa leptomitoformis]|uniref:4-hydroxy-4-methyl-2-oxoglutarate aldolase n=1 Tax=Beggiatoa leptomitoformis TaxID=288004 RepID=A0A2N9YB64_9GAMM|nr:ribonuclease E activity regulator RraA [Beggiatoa leptomitoformis]ALG66934.1 ribonuclease E activity regulator RraA [Beggiatoa leptomitoformis]AUI67700.1 ribonuclease E activity regulator RraA [Beggiatoa leptomitoformis]